MSSKWYTRQSSFSLKFLMIFLEPIRMCASVVSIRISVLFCVYISFGRWIILLAEIQENTYASFLYYGRWIWIFIGVVAHDEYLVWYCVCARTRVSLSLSHLFLPKKSTSIQIFSLAIGIWISTLLCSSIDKFKL